MSMLVHQRLSKAGSVAYLEGIFRAKLVLLENSSNKVIMGMNPRAGRGSDRELGMDSCQQN